MVLFYPLQFGAKRAEGVDKKWYILHLPKQNDVPVILKLYELTVWTLGPEESY